MHDTTNWVKQWFGIKAHYSDWDKDDEWIHKPAVKLWHGNVGRVDDKNNKADPMRLIVEPASLDMQAIGTINAPPLKRFEFRPQTWAQFIGQPQAKARVPTIQAQFARGMRAHIILSAIRGHGKTSYIELLAKTLNARLIQRIGNAITLDTIPELINEINTSGQQCVLFIDEIDTMPKELIKIFNSIVESFQISGKRIKPFIFACATINKYLLYKNNPDFLDRLQHDIVFTRYSIEELTQIIKQVSQQLYSNEHITDDDLRTLAMNCKFNPRSAINLLEFFVVEKNIEKVLHTCCIIKDGLTDTDINILKFLVQCNRPVGANAVAMKVGMSQNEYVNEWESFLYEFGYLNRLPSRVITDKGREFLTSINQGGTK